MHHNYDDGARVQKRNGAKGVTYQRLWWMEVTRGISTVSFSLLFLATGSFATHLFIYSLGVYFVIDGLLELYGVRREKDVSQYQHRIFDYGEGATGLLIGLFSLVLPGLTLLLLADIIAVRIIVSSISHMRTARRTHGTFACFLWTSSGLFMLMGLFILLFPWFVIIFLVAFLGIYMLVAGLFLLRRGLSPLPGQWPSRPLLSTVLRSSQLER